MNDKTIKNIFIIYLVEYLKKHNLYITPSIHNTRFFSIDFFCLKDKPLKLNSQKTINEYTRLFYTLYTTIQKYQSQINILFPPNTLSILLPKIILYGFKNNETNNYQKIIPEIFNKSLQSLYNIHKPYYHFFNIKLNPTRTKNFFLIHINIYTEPTILKNIINFNFKYTPIIIKIISPYPSIINPY